jgi:hypothetical protein
MAAALESLRSDPVAAAAFEEQRRFDSRVAGALAEVPVPADLRGSLIAGARLAEAAQLGGRSTSGAPGGAVPGWAKAAAAVAVLAAASGAAYLAFRPGGGGAGSVVTSPAAVGPEVSGERPGPPAGGPGFLVPVVPVNSVQRTIAVLDRAMGGQPGDETGHDVELADLAGLTAWLERRLGGGVVMPDGLAGRPVRLCSFFRDTRGGIALVCFDVGGSTKLHLTISEFDGADRLPESPSKCGIGRCRQWEFVAWHQGTKQYVLVADVNDPECCEHLRVIAGA